jgi:hypothetical protein
MDSTTCELPLLVVVVYLPRIQIWVVGGYPATTLMGRPFGRSGRASGFSDGKIALWCRQRRRLGFRLDGGPKLYIYCAGATLSVGGVVVSQLGDELAWLNVVVI